MSSVQFEVFNNRCGKCNAEFHTFVLPQHIYGLVFAATENEETIIIDVDEDETWKEVEILVKDILVKNQIDFQLENELFDLVFTSTIDPSPSGKNYFLWGKVPCKKCHSFERTYFGPDDPPTIIEVTPLSYSHEIWNSKSAEEKTNHATSIVLDRINTRSMQEQI